MTSSNWGARGGGAPVRVVAVGAGYRLGPGLCGHLQPSAGSGEILPRPVQSGADVSRAGDRRAGCRGDRGDVVDSGQDAWRGAAIVAIVGIGHTDDDN